MSPFKVKTACHRTLFCPVNSISAVVFSDQISTFKLALDEYFLFSLRLIYDPGTGKPRGFGFCEYEDAETAMSAVRNLAGRELSGRPLRIDSAANAPSAGGTGMGGPGMNSDGFRGPGAGPGLGPKPVEVKYGLFSVVPR